MTHDQFWTIVYEKLGWAIQHPTDVLLGAFVVLVFWRAVR